ncbi:MAG: hypothetical protein ACP5I8_01380 [Phycisphaerae bacterium]
MHARQIIGVIVSLTLGGLIGGCASVQVKPVSVTQVNDPAIVGVRFFQPQPYLLVTEMPSMPTPPKPMLLHGLMRLPIGPMNGRMSCPMMRPRGGPQHGVGKPMMKWQGMNRPGRRHGTAMGPVSKRHGMAGMMALGEMRHLPPQQRVFKLQIIYLPDYSHPYVAVIQGGLGHSPNSLVLANGWELLGLNVKGPVAQSRPIHAITAAPALRQVHGRMTHPMLMPLHAAMAMGLQPGLYRFIFNAKNGKLEGLRRIGLLKPHHWRRPMGMMKWKNSNRLEPHPMQSAATPMKESGK